MPRWRARVVESLELYRELGDSDGIIEGLNTLGEFAVIQEDPARATTLLEESLALADRWVMRMAQPGRSTI